MKPFYEELKELREKKEIDLDQIQQRTKINKRFLEAIEEGEFDVLPSTYVKLFLRAYVTEIGADPEEALEQYGHFVNKDLEPKKPEKPVEEEVIVDDIPKEIKNVNNLFSFTNIKLRSKIVKGILLLALWFFIIYVIKQISSDENGANGSSRVNPAETQVGNIITEEKLATDFVVLSSREESMDTNSPFSVKVVTTESLGYQVKFDSELAKETFLPSGDQETYSFNEMLDLLLNQSTGVNIFINGKSIPKLNPQLEPVRVTFSANPLKVSIKHYTKLE